MTRRLLPALALLVLAAAPLPEAWRHWLYSRPIALPDGAGSGLASVAVPPEIYGHARRDLADLRVIDDLGREVPYVLRARVDEMRRVTAPTRLLEVSYLPGRYTQAFIEVSPPGAIHNAVRLETDEKDFFRWVEVAVSDDGRTWRILRGRAPIYRFEPEVPRGAGADRSSSERVEGNPRIVYGDSRSPHLRIRILDGEKQFPLRGAEVSYEARREREYSPLPVTFKPDPEASPRESAWRADLGERQAPVSRVRFEVAQREFHRPVRVSASDDGKHWDYVGSGVICRVLDVPEKPDECLNVTFPETQARHLRATIYNRDDRPLDGVRLTLEGTPRRILFEPEAGRAYRLIYANERAKPPDYEIARTAWRKDADPAMRATLGPVETNAGYADPRPWSERHPLVLWIAVGIAVGGMGLLAIRSLKGAGADGAPPP